MHAGLRAWFISRRSVHRHTDTHFVQPCHRLSSCTVILRFPARLARPRAAASAAAEAGDPQTRTDLPRYGIGRNIE